MNIMPCIMREPSIAAQSGFYLWKGAHMNNEIIIALILAGLWTWRRLWRIRSAHREQMREQFAKRLTEVIQ